MRVYGSSELVGFALETGFVLAWLEVWVSTGLSTKENFSAVDRALWPPRLCLSLFRCSLARLAGLFTRLMRAGHRALAVGRGRRAAGAAGSLPSIQT